jgi:hypothetical protein
MLCLCGKIFFFLPAPLEVSAQHFVGKGYFSISQARWIRSQASVRSSVEVA